MASRDEQGGKSTVTESGTNLKKDIGYTVGLLVNDLQNDFLTGPCSVDKIGTSGDSPTKMMTSLDFLLKENGQVFDEVIFSVDKHPKNHCSHCTEGCLCLYSYTPNAHLFKWPPHCVIGLPGGEIAYDTELLKEKKIKIKIVEKGIDRHMEEISCMRDVAGNWSKFAKYAKKNLDILLFCGMYQEVGITYAAIDAYKLGIRVGIIKDASIFLTGFGAAVEQPEPRNIPLLTQEEAINIANGTYLPKVWEKLLREKCISATVKHFFDEEPQGSIPKKQDICSQTD